MLKNLLLAILIWTALSIKLRVTVDRNKGPVCFYESLKAYEKYRYMVVSDIHNFRMDVMYSKEGRGSHWEEVVTIMGKRMSEQINKIAQMEGIYTFCISTPEARAFKATLYIETGLQQANLDYLPSMNDHQILEKEVLWMQKQKETLKTYIRNIESRKSSGEAIKNMLGSTMLILVIIGVIVIAAVNYSFFLLTKKTLKERKMI